MQKVGTTVGILTGGPTKRDILREMALTTIDS
jgi:hypothetical protein